MSRPGGGRVPVIIFHSTFGLRPVELAAADRLRRAGHRVGVPDLFGGAVADGADGIPTLEAGFALQKRIGWETVIGRARESLRALPPETVLCGFSMGVGVISTLWPERLEAAGAIFFHATTEVPAGVAAGTPVQTHAAVDDRFAPADRLARFTESAARVGADAACYTYPGAGHFYTDPSLPDHEPAAAALTWQRIEALLASLPG